MKSKKFLKTELSKIFKKELKIKVKEKSKIYDFIRWDSLGNFNILLACEKKFNIKFSNKEFNNLSSYKSILNALSGK